MADNWPYVNGRSLLSGITLFELDASDMLDVVHYMFEDDLRVSSAEEAEAISKIRETMYPMLYGRPYKSIFTGSKPKYNMNTASSGPIPTVSTPPGSERKPYIPPTQFDPDSPVPFGEKLDSPLK